MATLTPATLRHLARLYRAEVEGADEALRHLLREHGEELSALLGVSRDALEHVASRADAVDMLVAAIEDKFKIQLSTKEIMKMSSIGLARKTLQDKNVKV